MGWPTPEITEEKARRKQTLLCFSTAPRLCSQLLEHRWDISPALDLQNLISMNGLEFVTFVWNQQVEPELVPQTDLVPTLALLLGVPIPYSSVGQVMLPLFTRDSPRDAPVGLSQVEALWINVKQVRNRPSSDWNGNKAVPLDWKAFYCFLIRYNVICDYKLIIKNSIGCVSTTRIISIRIDPASVIDPTSVVCHHLLITENLQQVFYSSYSIVFCY